MNDSPLPSKERSSTFYAHAPVRYGWLHTPPGTEGCDTPAWVPLGDYMKLQRELEAARRELATCANLAGNLMAQRTADEPDALHQLVRGLRNVADVAADGDTLYPQGRQEARQLIAQADAWLSGSRLPPGRDYTDHYKQRLRDLLPYACHRVTCRYLETSRPPCDCGFAAIGAIAHAEVGHLPASAPTKCDEVPK